ncbi:MAG: hypothetical protein L6V92_00840 [Phocaeicola vulgatus]|nr:MAG: hypothetical protein L6V92_00840 [Phocaeicola vulgatus]
MAVTKIRKVSSWTLLISSIISVVALIMFYTGGVVDPAAEMKEPVYTGLLLNWTYVLFGLTIASTIVLAAWQFLGSLKNDAKSALMSLLVLVLFVALLGITYTLGDATPLTGLNADSQAYNTTGWLKITDMWIYSTYALIALIILAVVWGTIRRILSR